MSLHYITQILPSLFQGAGMTLELFFLTLIGSLPLGIICSLGLVSKIKPLKWFLEFYVWLMRGIGIVFQRFDAALIAFILNYAAYFAEIFRGGLQSIDEGQYEGARVLGLSYWQTVRKIVIPQVVKIVIPSIGNEVVNLVKDSSLVYVIGLGDLLRAGNVATSRDVTLVPLLLVGVIYLIMVGICTYILHKVEKRYSYYK